MFGSQWCIDISLKHPLKFGGTALQLMSLQGFINRVTQYKTICIYVYPRYCKIFCSINWVKHSFSIYGSGCIFMLQLFGAWLVIDVFIHKGCNMRKAQRSLIITLFFYAISSCELFEYLGHILLIILTQMFSSKFNPERIYKWPCAMPPKYWMTR